MTERLPREFGLKWISALRSGDYHQAQGTLYHGTDNNYCCLGLAGAICGIPIEMMDGIGMVSDWDGGEGRHQELYEMALQKGYPIELIDDVDGSNKFSHHLASMNDDGSTFDDIADYIEEYVDLYDPITLSAQTL